MNKLGMMYHNQHGHEMQIPNEIRDTVTVANIPRNMHPDHNRERRKARAEALLRSFGRERKARFVDAAEYLYSHKYTAVVIDTGSKTKIACSVYTNHSEIAEEVAIALALTDQECEVVLSDSQTAVMN